MNENKKVQEETNKTKEPTEPTQSTETQNKEVPEEFSKILKDFYKDILLVFPEMKYKLEDSTIEFLQNKHDGNEIFEHCLTVFPERFFDIL